SLFTFRKNTTLERDVVVHVAVAATAAGGNGAARRAADGTGGTEVAARFVAEAAASPATAADVEPRQRRGEALGHDLRGGLPRPALVGPFAGLERALDVNLGALLEVLLGD